MEKIAIIDLGSNTVRLLLVEVKESGHFQIVDQLKEAPRLGEGMERDGFLKPQRIAETVKTLKMFKKLCDASGVERIIAVGTAAENSVAVVDTGEAVASCQRVGSGCAFGVIDCPDLPGQVQLIFEAVVHLAGEGDLLGLEFHKRTFVHCFGEVNDLFAQNFRVLGVIAESVLIGDLAYAVGVAGAFPGSRQGRQQHGSKNSDDRYYNQQFDKGKVFFHFWTFLFG